MPNKQRKTDTIWHHIKNIISLTIASIVIALVVGGFTFYIGASVVIKDFRDSEVRIEKLENKSDGMDKEIISKLELHIKDQNEDFRKVFQSLERIEGKQQLIINRVLWGQK